ncbi:guanylate cyclase domain-containing protein [Haematococcus lacustris]|uniref:Guanylate cyclase domain-containing protein n=1 Tax=Haematococcus lacustris TaxID=44745 RepID=A0A699Z0A0_HAELA|nr:guanylate cyclase domain-containing protein [Haematococcus lacustris]
MSSVPKEALAFALDAQLKLLHLPWPPALLELPAWQAVYVKGRYKKLPLERLWDKHLVLHHGTAPVSPSESAAGSQALQGTLYQALSRCLEGRLAYLPPALSTNPTQQQLQEQQQLERDPGVLLAPAGCVTVVFSYVVGTQGGAELRRWGGYAVEAVDGLFLAAFQSPAHAVLWALRCNELLVQQPWSRALLAHELCEEVHMSSSTPEGFQVNALLFRGLRLKTGLDRGQVMNRAARIASAATSGQVLCSAAAWAHVSSQEEGVLQEQQLSAVSLGQSRLKGVTDNMELMLCRKAGPPKCDVQGPRHPLGEEWPWSQQAAQGLPPSEVLLSLAPGGQEEEPGEHVPYLIAMQALDPFATDYPDSDGSDGMDAGHTTAYDGGLATSSSDTGSDNDHHVVDA